MNWMVTAIVAYVSLIVGMGLGMWLISCLMANDDPEKPDTDGLRDDTSHWQ